MSFGRSMFPPPPTGKYISPFAAIAPFAKRALPMAARGQRVVVSNSGSLTR